MQKYTKPSAKSVKPASVLKGLTGWSDLTGTGPVVRPPQPYQTKVVVMQKYIKPSAKSVKPASVLKGLT